MRRCATGRDRTTWPACGGPGRARPGPRCLCCSCTAGSGGRPGTGPTPGRWPWPWPRPGSPCARRSSGGPARATAAGGPARSTTSPRPSTPCPACSATWAGRRSLWAAARHRLPAGLPWHRAGPAPIRAVVALAAVSELTACYDEGLGDGAAGALIGGSPADHPDRYAVTDPARLLPIGIPLWLVHGALDDRVPAAMSRSFTGRARAAGDEVAARELPGGDHFDLIDPSSAAWPDVLGAFRAVAGPAGTA